VEFEFPATLVRLRRTFIRSPNGNAQRRADWDDPAWPPEEVPIEGGAIGPSSSQRVVTIGREQVTTSVSLLTEVDPPIQVGDRIREPSGALWDVVGQPLSYRSPFDGWAAGAETPLVETRG